MTLSSNPRARSWGAVLALTLCVSTLIASEFMPVSLLTPIAMDLRLTEGRAGQAIAVSGVFAVVTSLLIASLARSIDRRRVLLALTGLMLVSGVVVALAPNFPVLIFGRAMLGVVIGGFWSLSAATVMRLVPEREVPRALAVLNGGNALATTIAAPLGSFLGQYIGWRGAFFAVVPLAAVTFAWQFITLPPMPAKAGARPARTLAVLRRPGASVGMLAVTFLFAGQFALFTYLRPFLESVTGVGVSTLSLVLLGMGAAGLVGTYLIGFVVPKRLTAVLVAAPIAMALVALALVALGKSLPAVAVLLAAWGLIGTAAPVAWWTWLARTLPDDAEAGGGLMVAAIQLAITAGASIGGLLFDTGGHRATFVASAALLGAAALLAFRASRPRRVQRLTGPSTLGHLAPRDARTHRFPCGWPSPQASGAVGLQRPRRRGSMKTYLISSIATLLALGCAAARGAGEPSGGNGGQVAVTSASHQRVAPGPAETFTGSVSVRFLFEATEHTRAGAASVTFEPKARSAWHSHPAGQILVVTEGTGWVQQWGGERLAIKAGDVVRTPPGVKHWHGASSDSRLTHLAIQEHVEGKVVDWMEHVTDEQYGGGQGPR